MKNLFCQFLKNEWEITSRLIFQEAPGPPEPVSPKKAAEAPPLRPKYVPELSLSDISERILKNPKIVILDVNETWCGPCKELAKTLEAIHGLFEDQLQVFKFTRDTNEEATEIQKRIPDSNNVKGFPTLIYFHGGRQREVQLGASPLKLVQNLKTLGLKMTPDQERQIYLIAARYQPSFVLDQLNDFPLELQKTCLRITVHDNPYNALSDVTENPEKWKRIDPDKAMLKLAILAAAERGPEDPVLNTLFTRERLKMIADLGLVAEVLLRTAKVQPAIVINYSPRIAQYQHETAVKILTVAIEKDPFAALANGPYQKWEAIGKVNDNELLNAALRNALAKDPKKFLTFEQGKLFKIAEAQGKDEQLIKYIASKAADTLYWAIKNHAVEGLTEKPYIVAALKIAKTKNAEGFRQTFDEPTIRSRFQNPQIAESVLQLRGDK